VKTRVLAVVGVASVVVAFLGSAQIRSILVAGISMIAVRQIGRARKGKKLFSPALVDVLRSP